MRTRLQRRNSNALLTFVLLLLICWLWLVVDIIGSYNNISDEDQVLKHKQIEKLRQSLQIIQPYLWTKQNNNSTQFNFIQRYTFYNFSTSLN